MTIKQSFGGKLLRAVEAREHIGSHNIFIIGSLLQSFQIVVTIHVVELEVAEPFIPDQF